MDYNRRKDFEKFRELRKLGRRLLVFRICLGLAFAAIYAGLWYLQIWCGDEYRYLADNNRLRRVVVPAQRGMMYDRKGRLVVSNREGYTIVLNREKPYDAARIASELAGPLGLPEDELRTRIERYRGRPTFERAILKEDVGFADVAYIESRRSDFPMLQIVSEPRRDYVSGPETAHLVGYTGEASPAQLKADASLMMGDTVGRTGIERAYDGRIRGRNGEELVEVNSLGRKIRTVDEGRSPLPGGEVPLTIDLEMQKKLVESLQGEVGAGIFLDPRNGEVYALASTPSFDPNLFARRFTLAEWKNIIEDPDRPLQNRVTQGLYAAGSTYKLVVAFAGLEGGIIDEGTSVSCSGGAMFFGRRFGCWKKGGHGTVGLLSAIAQSCNVYFYTVGNRIGIDRIAAEATKFGFGQPTGIDIPGEELGTVASPAWKMATFKEPWYAGETISVSIGQGATQVTAAQMANFAAEIATGGTAYKPKTIRPARGTPVTPELLRTVTIDPHALSVIRRSMLAVVESGTASKARIPGISIAGKTGTVQVYKASSGVESTKLSKLQRDHGWFIGYAPAENPTIAFAVLVEHGGHGGTISAPIVRKVLEVYFGVPPRPEPGEPKAPASPDRAGVQLAGYRTR